MADQKITQLTELTSPASGDLLAIVDDPSGTPETKKIDINNLGLLTGWVYAGETWTRTGNHTFTVSGDVTAKYRKGTKIRYKDGGSYEYSVVIDSSYSSPNTTVTLMTNTDYTMAAATITDNFISYVQTPEGYPDWFNIAAPTWNTAQLDDGAGGQPTTALCRGKVEGKMFKGYIRLSSAYTASGLGYWYFTASTTFPTIVNRPSRSIVGCGHSQTTGDTNMIHSLFTISSQIYMMHPTGSTIADNTQYANISYMFEWEI